MAAADLRRGPRSDTIRARVGFRGRKGSLESTEPEDTMARAVPAAAELPVIFALPLGLALVLVSALAGCASPSHFESGQAKLTAGDHRGAIEELDQAIAEDPQMAAAYKERGLAKHQVDDVDGAIADYSRAIELDPKLAMAYNNRANARRTKGDYKGSLDDCTKALEVNPAHDFAYVNRGYAHFLLGDEAAAAADLEKALGLKTSYRDYPNLWLWVIRSRRGEREMADKALRAHLSERTGPKDDWAATVASFLVGDIAEEAFVRDHVEKAPADELAGRRCEGNCYAGYKRLFAGEREKARELFQRSVDTKLVAYVEQHAAALELGRLGKATPPGTR